MSDVRVARTVDYAIGKDSKPPGLGLCDDPFDLVAVHDGLYGEGVQHRPDTALFDQVVCNNLEEISIQTLAAIVWPLDRPPHLCGHPLHLRADTLAVLRALVPVPRKCLHADGGGTDSPSRQIDERKGSRLETAFWMGGAGARSGWHYDADYGMNVLVHLRGTKNITLAPPSQTPRLYPSPRFDPGATLSLVDFWAPDEGTYPLYSSIRTQTLTIQPGDVLLIPAGWWHAVESSSVSVSLSVRYMDMVENAVNYVDRWKEYLHEKGLYGSKKDCVCHSERVVQRHDLE